MDMANHWNPESYTLEDQLWDMLGGRDVVTGDDGTVMKGNANHVDIYWGSDSDRGHGHAGFDYDDNGKFIGWKKYHD